MKKYYLFYFLSFFLYAPAQVFVTPTGAGTGNGSSWANAATLQNAISTMAANSQIWLKSGVYSISTTLDINNNASNVKLYGGFAGTETSLNQRNYLTNVTTLDGQTTTQILIIRNDAIEVNGITFTNGFITGTITGGTNPNTGGGAIRIMGSNSILRNCKFLNNVSTSERGGGALFIWYGEGHLIENCEFQGNVNRTADGNGGGAIHNWEENVIIRNCKFIGNRSTNDGGALYTWVYNLTISGCIFENNHADESGGAIHTRSIANLSNSVFKSNSCTENGGAIYTSEALKVTNSLFNQNTAVGLGGGIFNAEALYVSNSTFVSNQGSGIIHSNFQTSGSFTRLTHIFNSIFYNNTTLIPGKLADVDKEANGGTDQSDKDFRRNIFQANSFGSNNLVGTNPLFENFAANNFTLQSSSPAKNFGENALYNTVSQLPASASTDLAGNPRLGGSAIDLGAYEFPESLSVPENSASTISLYPNPVQDFVTISKIASGATYTIANLTGQFVAKGTIYNNNLDLRKLDSGVYVIFIEDGTKSYTKKIIKN